MGTQFDLAWASNIALHHSGFAKRFTSHQFSFFVEFVAFTFVSFFLV